MLSKIAFFETDHRPDIAADRARVLPALLHHLQSSDRNAGAAPATGGTLGLCFEAEIAGAKRFLKTHLPDQAARTRLAREADILGRLYGGRILLDRFEFRLDDGTHRLCLLMPTLAPLPGAIPSADSLAIMREYNERLGDWRPDNLPSLEQYLTVAARALHALSDHQLLDQPSAAETRRLVRLLDEGRADLPKAFCHGDFGPKNIMLHGTERCVIDWEDAFLGIAGYDYLYWLTFMENRLSLQTAAFGSTGLSSDIERAILVLVVLLKSYLAACSGAHLKHAVSAQGRIAEILELR